MLGIARAAGVRWTVYPRWADNLLGKSRPTTTCPSGVLSYCLKWRFSNLSNFLITRKEKSEHCHLQCSVVTNWAKKRWKWLETGKLSKCIQWQCILFQWLSACVEEGSSVLTFAFWKNFIWMLKEIRNYLTLMADTYLKCSILYTQNITIIRSIKH